jgi:4-hydroxy-2-oxoheptanedioate aldolase
VPGIDAIFVGPNDLAASMRSKDNKPPSGKATKEALDHVLATCKKHKVAAGIHCFSADEVNARISEGWQFLALTSELKMMLNGAAVELQKIGTGAAQGDAAKY